MALSQALVAGTCVAGLGVLLHVIGMATPHWMNSKCRYGIDASIGLFQACAGDSCGDISDLKSQNKAVQAMAILGVLAGGAGVLGAIAFVALTRMGKNPHGLIRLASGFLCLSGGMFITICVIVYGAKIYKDAKGHGISLGYSFRLSISGDVLLLLGGCIILAKRGSQEEVYTS